MNTEKFALFHQAHMKQPNEKELKLVHRSVFAFCFVSLSFSALSQFPPPLRVRDIQGSHFILTYSSPLYRNPEYKKEGGSGERKGSASATQQQQQPHLMFLLFSSSLMPYILSIRSYKNNKIMPLQVVCIQRGRKRKQNEWMLFNAESFGYRRNNQKAAKCFSYGN